MLVNSAPLNYAVHFPRRFHFSRSFSPHFSRRFSSRTLITAHLTSSSSPSFSVARKHHSVHPRRSFIRASSSPFSTAATSPAPSCPPMQRLDQHHILLATLHLLICRLHCQNFSVSVSDYIFIYSCSNSFASSRRRGFHASVL